MPALIPKNKARVIYTLLILALVMQKVTEEADITTDDALTRECTTLMDSLLTRMPEAARDAVIARIQNERVKFTKKCGNIDAASALVGAIRIVVGDTFKSTAGTHFDFVRQVLRKNLQNIETVLPINEKEADKFASQFKVSIFAI